MIALEVSLSCLLKTSFMLWDIAEKLFHKNKKLGLYIPAELKAEAIKFLESKEHIAVIDLDEGIYNMIKPEDKMKLNSVASKKVAREKLIKLSFKEIHKHFDKVIYISSDAQLIKKNFVNLMFMIPNEVFLHSTKLASFNKDLIELMKTSIKIKKFIHFDSVLSLTNELMSRFC